MSEHCLFGRDYTGTAEGGEKSGSRVGIAISKGGAAKLYRHTDPNEDACLALEGEAGVLLAVADGHGGEEAARVAIESLRETARPWCSDPNLQSDRVWHERFAAIFTAMHETVLALRVTDGSGKIQRAARTTLSLILLRRPEERVLACSIGDSHVFRVGADRCDDLAWPRDAERQFLGSGSLLDGDPLRALCFSANPAKGCVALVAATDGLSEPGIGVADPVQLVRGAIAEIDALPRDRRAAAGAKRIVDEACETQHQNGAGDNIAVAVAWCGT